MCQFIPGSYAAVQLNDSLFAPFPMNTAEVRWVTCHTIARNFRATTKAHPSKPKEARRLAGAYVRFAPLLALPPESSSGCMWMNTGPRWSQSDKSGNLNSGFLNVRALGYFIQTRSSVGQLLQPWLVRIMQQKKVMSWLSKYQRGSNRLPQWFVIKIGPGELSELKKQFYRMQLR